MLRRRGPRRGRAIRRITARLVFGRPTEQRLEQVEPVRVVLGSAAHTAWPRRLRAVLRTRAMPTLRMIGSHSISAARGRFFRARHCRLLRGRALVRLHGTNAFARRRRRERLLWRRFHGDCGRRRRGSIRTVIRLACPGSDRRVGQSAQALKFLGSAQCSMHEPLSPFRMRGTVHERTERAGGHRNRMRQRPARRAQDHQPCDDGEENAARWEDAQDRQHHPCITESWLLRNIVLTFAPAPPTARPRSLSAQGGDKAVTDC